MLHQEQHDFSRMVWALLQGFPLNIVQVHGETCKTAGLCVNIHVALQARQPGLAGVR